MNAFNLVAGVPGSHRDDLFATVRQLSAGAVRLRSRQNRGALLKTGGGQGWTAVCCWGFAVGVEAGLV